MASEGERGRAREVEGERKELTYGGWPEGSREGSLKPVGGVGGGRQGRRASMPQNVDRERRVPHPFVLTHRFRVEGFANASRRSRREPRGAVAEGRSRRSRNPVTTCEDVFHSA